MDSDVVRTSASNPAGDTQRTRTAQHPSGSGSGSGSERRRPMTRVGPSGHGTPSINLPKASIPTLQSAWSPPAWSPDWSFTEPGGGYFPPADTPTTTAMPLQGHRGGWTTSAEGHLVDEADVGNTPSVITKALSGSSVPGALPYSKAIFSQAPASNDALQLPFFAEPGSGKWAGPTVSSVSGPSAPDTARLAAVPKVPAIRTALSPKSKTHFPEPTSPSSPYEPPSASSSHAVLKHPSSDLRTTLSPSKGKESLSPLDKRLDSM